MYLSSIELLSSFSSMIFCQFMRRTAANQQSNDRCCSGSVSSPIQNLQMCLSCQHNVDISYCSLTRTNQWSSYQRWYRPNQTFKRGLRRVAKNIQLLTVTQLLLQVEFTSFSILFMSLTWLFSTYYRCSNYIASEMRSFTFLSFTTKSRQYD